MSHKDLPPADMLVRGHWVIAGPNNNDIYYDGAVVIAGDIIVDVGNYKDLKLKFPTIKEKGSNKHIVIPGLINTHHHSFGLPFSLHGVADTTLELWLQNIRGITNLPPILSAQLSATRLLQSGVTAVIDMCGLSGHVDSVNQVVRDKLAGYDKTGIRTILAPGIRTKGFLVYGDKQDQNFIDTLPNNLQEIARHLLPGRNCITTTQYFDLFEQWHQHIQTKPLLDVWFGPPGAHWVDGDILQEMAKIAESNNLGMQTHASESKIEYLESLRTRGHSSIEYLYKLGVLSPRFSIAHGVWANASDIAMLAETGSHLSHNPSSNLRLQCGIAPINNLLNAKVSTTLGMDAMTINDDDDFFSEMRLALRLQHQPDNKESTLSPQTVFSMATRTAADLINQKNKLGELRPGAKADLVLLNSERILWPWVAPDINPIDLIVLRAKSQDVDTVIIAGNTVLKKGQPTQFDIKDLHNNIVYSLEKSSSYPKKNLP
ncbi:MAG: amidohydrolase family protein [Cellvibrionaceae bacterium]